MEQLHQKKCLEITGIFRKQEDENHLVVEYHLRNGDRETVIWYRMEREFEDAVCYDRCDAAVTVCILAAMKAGFTVIRSELPISEKLYYQLTYHVIPQLYVAGSGKLPKIRLQMPITKTCFHGSMVAMGMSRGVDSFASMYEYCDNFELDAYRVNTFTYFQAGAHHGWDATVGRGEESRQELFENQLNKTREMCRKYGYPLIVIESNVDEVLQDKAFFKEWSFDRTHTFRNLSMAMLMQKGISKYYYSSAYTLNEFKLTLYADMAHYERWLIPHLGTGSIEFYQSNQDWCRMDKVEKLSHLEISRDYLQVCLTKSGNCGNCMKCKRTLMELDALGDDVLEKYRNSFDVDRYRRENRKKWFSAIMTDKEKNNSEAHFFDEIFVCASENHPELLKGIKPEKELWIRKARLKYDGINIRALPSLRSKIITTGKKDTVFDYGGSYPNWVKIRTEDGKTGYVYKQYVELMKR